MRSGCTLYWFENGAVNHTTAEKLDIEALIPHQPIPFTTKALAVLQKKGCIVVPCFIPVAGPLFHIGWTMKLK